MWGPRSRLERNVDRCFGYFDAREFRASIIIIISTFVSHCDCKGPLCYILEVEVEDWGRCESISARNLPSGFPRAEMKKSGWKYSFFWSVKKEIKMILLFDICKFLINILQYQSNSTWRCTKPQMSLPSSKLSFCSLWSSGGDSNCNCFKIYKGKRTYRDIPLLAG